MPCKVVSMSEQKPRPQGRTLLAGKVVSNFGRSSIDCIVRRMSDRGATISVASPLGIPQHFQLLITDEGIPRPCKLVWQSDKDVGVEFELSEAANQEAPSAPAQTERRGDTIMRGQMLALRAALDEVKIGVVLLDGDLRAQFINRAFREMWKLPDAVADSRPAFAALMYHGRDTSAYQVAQSELDDYVAHRVERVRDGDTNALDLRRSDGEVIRMQCAVLPNGGRMLSYTDVTDIVRHSDELELLRNALDNISEGVVLLDANLKTHFLNTKMRGYFGVTDEQVAARPSYEELITHAPHANAHGVAPEKLDEFFAAHVEAVRTADRPICDATAPDGRRIRVHCAVTPGGGRMMTYCDITDLIRNAELLEKLAIIDSLTGLYNRRHFLTLADAEWSRFQRYRRPLSMLMIDIDHFKAVNDRYGHAVGDQAIISVAKACEHGKRASDAIGRLGGEEFAILLPETDSAQAAVVAERIRERVAGHVLSAHGVQFKITISAGIASAALSMPGIDALLRAADEALYRAKAEGRNRVAHRAAPSTPRLAAE
jgi:diguanylate cyclase (GGDEF)-like protein